MSDLDLRQADQLARDLARELPEPCRADFLRLSRALIHGPKFQWLLAETPSDALRNRLLAALDRVTHVAHLHCSRLPLDRTIADVSALEGALARHAKGSAVVHVLAQRGWFDRARWDAFNVRRERLTQEARARLVFWLDAEAIEAASSGAPDLWAWRSGVYSFAELPLVVETPASGLVTISPGVPIDDRPVRERLDRIQSIQQWLKSQGASLADDQRVGAFDELGRLLFSVGEFDQALRHWQESELPLHVRRGDEWAAVVTKGQIADILQARGQLDEALRIRQDESLPVYERLGDVREAAITKGKIADILQARGQLDEALRIRQDESLPVYERLGDVREAAITKGQIADILQARGQLDEALRIQRDEAVPVFERLGDVRNAAVSKVKIANILQARGQFDEALRIWKDESLPVFERLGDARSAAVTRAKIGLQLADHGPDRGAATAWLTAAYKSLRAMRLPEADQLAELMRSRGISPEGDETAPSPPA